MILFFIKIKRSNSIYVESFFQIRLCLKEKQYYSVVIALVFIFILIFTSTLAFYFDFDIGFILNIELCFCLFVCRFFILIVKK